MQIVINMLNKTKDDCKCDHNCGCGDAEKIIIQGLMHQKSLNRIKKESLKNDFFADQFVPGIIDNILKKGSK